MAFTTLADIATTRSMNQAFYGYNHNLSVNDGEFYDMTNLTSSYFPVLSPRGKRGIYPYATTASLHKPHGLVAKDNLCYVDGTTLYVDNYAINGLVLTDTPKQLISMGAYIIIMPDKKYINTKSLTDFGDIEASFTTTDNVSYDLCSVTGEAYTGVTVSVTEPVDPENSALWIDSSSTPHVLKQYSINSAMWIQIPTTYVKISSPNIAAAFSQYDGVKITGIDGSVAPQLAELLNGNTSVLYDAYHDTAGNGANDYLVVIGLLDQSVTQSQAVTISRRMPNLDFITECENRLWGCRYGTDLDGNIVNEIYACKLGDFKNWNVYMGLSSDSYTASCGTDGQWTGAVTHLGYPIFFKETCLHKVYGNFPSNFQIQTTICRGVQKGAGDSLAIVNETLYYKGRSGVYAYDGSLPTEISAPLGADHYTALDTSLGVDPLRCGAVAGAHHNKYYISMKSDMDNKWYLFTYDASMNLWHKEDETRADAFCSCRDEMYFIDHADKKIKTVLGSGTPEDGDVSWMAETGVLGADIPDNKTLSKILVRMSLAVGTRVRFFAEYDSTGKWEHLATMVGTSLRSFTVPIRPKRADHFRLRIEGTGEAKIYSITKTLEQRSDLFR